MSVVPSAILETAEACRSAIGPDGEPPYSLRREILVTFDRVKRHPNEPRLRRALVAISCARNTLPIWERTFTSDKEPHKILSALDDALEGRIRDLEETEKQNDALLMHLEDQMEEGPKVFRASYAGFACYAAMASFLYDEELPIVPRGEIDFDANSWDASFYSSCAMCGGATWEPDTDAVARARFWEWYLSHAVPSAYERYV